MDIYDSDAVAQATISIMVRLLETLKQSKVLSPADISALINGAISDSAHHPQRAEVAAVIHAMAGSR
jgi:hypothetical protein